MYSNAFQKSGCLELLSSKGKNPLQQFKVGTNGVVKKEYCKIVKGNVFKLQGSTVQLVLPKPPLKLGLTMGYLLFQVYIPNGKEFSFEIDITDQKMAKRRLLFSTCFRESVTHSFHAQLPLNGASFPILRDEWCTLCVDIKSIVKHHFTNSMFRCCEQIMVSSTVWIRKIFAAHDEPYERLPEKRKQWEIGSHIGSTGKQQQSLDTHLPGIGVPKKEKIPSCLDFPPISSSMNQSSSSTFRSLIIYNAEKYLASEDSIKSQSIISNAVQHPAPGEKTTVVFGKTTHPAAPPIEKSTKKPYCLGISKPELNTRRQILRNSHTAKKRSRVSALSSLIGDAHSREEGKEFKAQGAEKQKLFNSSPRLQQNKNKEQPQISKNGKTIVYVSEGTSPSKVRSGDHEHIITVNSSLPKDANQEEEQNILRKRKLQALKCKLYTSRVPVTITPLAKEDMDEKQFENSKDEGVKLSNHVTWKASNVEGGITEPLSQEQGKSFNVEPDTKHQSKFESENKTLEKLEEDRPEHSPTRENTVPETDLNSEPIILEDPDALPQTLSPCNTASLFQWNLTSHEHCNIPLSNEAEEDSRTTHFSARVTYTSNILNSNDNNVQNCTFTDNLVSACKSDREERTENAPHTAENGNSKKRSALSVNQEISAEQKKPVYQPQEVINSTIGQTDSILDEKSNTDKVEEARESKNSYQEVAQKQSSTSSKVLRILVKPERDNIDNAEKCDTQINKNYTSDKPEDFYQDTAAAYHSSRASLVSIIEEDEHEKEVRPNESIVAKVNSSMKNTVEHSSTSIIAQPSQTKVSSGYIHDANIGKIKSKSGSEYIEPAGTNEQSDNTLESKDTKKIFRPPEFIPANPQTKTKLKRKLKEQEMACTTNSTAQTLNAKDLRDIRISNALEHFNGERIADDQGLKALDATKKSDEREEHSDEKLLPLASEIFPDQFRKVASAERAQQELNLPAQEKKNDEELEKKCAANTTTQASQAKELIDIHSLDAMKVLIKEDKSVVRTLGTTNKDFDDNEKLGDFKRLSVTSEFTPDQFRAANEVAQQLHLLAQKKKKLEQLEYTQKPAAALNTSKEGNILIERKFNGPLEADKINDDKDLRNMNRLSMTSEFTPDQLRTATELAQQLHLLKLKKKKIEELENAFANDYGSRMSENV